MSDQQQEPTIVFPFASPSLLAQLVKIHLQCGRPGFDPRIGKIPWRRERLPTPVFWPGHNWTTFTSLHSSLSVLSPLLFVLFTYSPPATSLSFPGLHVLVQNASVHQTVQFSLVYWGKKKISSKKPFLVKRTLSPLGLMLFPWLFLLFLPV